jgi:hypothetical protein
VPLPPQLLLPVVGVAVAGGFVGVGVAVPPVVGVAVALGGGVAVPPVVGVGVEGGLVGVAVPPPPLQEPLLTQSAGTFGGSQPTRDVCDCWQV